ncbi:LmeA family phospholipid-binding protein [Williamsia sp. SKLECPSW1]
MTHPHDPSHPDDASDTPSTERIPQPQQPQAWSQTRPFDTSSYPYPDEQPHDATHADPADPGDGSRPRRPRRRVGMIVGISALVVVLVLVIAGVGSELYLRNATKDCLQKSFSDLTGSSASVSLSKEPMLWQFATSKVPYVQIDTGGDNGQAIELHGRADDITGRSDGSTLGSLNATGNVPFTRIVALSKQGAQNSQDQSGGDSTSGDSSGLSGLFGGFTLTNVTGDQSTGTMTIDATVTVAIFPIPVSTEIKPVVSDGKLEFQVVKASALVFGVPSGFAQTIVDGVSKSLFPPLFDELDFQKLSVTSQGIDFAVRGSDVALDADSLGATGNNASSQGTCSVL